MDLPERVGRYLVEGLLGRGSMGTVYLAHDPVVDRRIALKVLRPTLGGEISEAARQRFLREARAAGRLSHPNIVTVFDVGEDPETGRSFIAMDYVEGQTLQAVTAAGRRLTSAEATTLVAVLAGALDHAHRKGVVHRDVKPANVILAADGRAKLTDFGVARLDTSELTLEGALLGTPVYMSPEQISGRPVDGRSDLYSLGVILYELLTGSRPFVAQSLPELSLAVTQQPTPDPLTLRPGLPAPLAAVVLRCLAKRPDDRFQSGAELVEALAGLGLGGAAATGDVFGGSREAALPPLAGSVFSVSDAVGPAAIGSETLPTVVGPRTAARLKRRWAAVVGALLLCAVVIATVVVLRGLAPGAPPKVKAPTVAAIVSPTPLATLPSSTPTPTLKVELVHRNRLGSPDISVRTKAPTVVATVRAKPLPTPPPPTPVPTATIELVHRNRLGSGDISVWVGGTRLWSTRMAAAKNPLARAAGNTVRQTISVPAGQHRITVHIHGQSMEVDTRAVIDTDLRPGETRVLRVNLNPYSEKMTLAWEE